LEIGTKTPCLEEYAVKTPAKRLALDTGFARIRNAMPAEQLCFFKFQRPLLERFGVEFFRNVPKSPGVYVFTGEQGRVLYVGQSQNLRLRLSYYKNAQPEREPRKIIKLVHQTRAIDLECCESAEAARLRELALIGQHRPRFNVANTLRPTYTFFGLRESAGGFTLRLSMNQSRREGEMMVGAFKNRGLCGRAFCSIARTIVAESARIESVYDFPAWLNSKAREWSAIEKEWLSSVEGLLRGDDAGLLEKAERNGKRASDSFLKQLYEADLLTLTEFFQLAQEMREVRRFHETPVVSQEALQVSAQQMKQPRPVRS
jgi:hypothetical protein